MKAESAADHESGLLPLAMINAIWQRSSMFFTLRRVYNFLFDPKTTSSPTSSKIRAIEKLPFPDMFFYDPNSKILFVSKITPEENMQKFAKGCVGKPRAGE